MLVPIHSLIPNFFSNIWRFGYQKLSHIYKALCVKFYVQSQCSVGEINEKPSWKLENVVSTIYNTISNINIAFSNCLRMRYIIAFFSPWMMTCILRKSEHICQFKENLLSKYFGPGTFNIHVTMGNEC